MYDAQNLNPGRSYITEISHDGIVSYEKEYINKTQFNKQKIIDIPKDKIDNFFYEIYNLSDSGEEKNYIIKDDCSYTVTITYSKGHKEIFEEEFII